MSNKISLFFTLFLIFVIILLFFFDFNEKREGLTALESLNEITKANANIKTNTSTANTPANTNETGTVTGIKPILSTVPASSVPDTKIMTTTIPSTISTISTPTPSPTPTISIPSQRTPASQPLAKCSSSVYNDMESCNGNVEDNCVWGSINGSTPLCFQRIVSTPKPLPLQEELPIQKQSQPVIRVTTQ